MAFSDQLQSIQEQMQGFDINDLSVDNIGSWPLLVKMISWVLAFCLIIFLGYYFLISDEIASYEKVKRKEVELRKEFKQKAFQAANLEAYRKQKEDMDESFDALISQLPSDTEVPGLLEDITNKGSISGLSFKTIDLQKEQTKEFYVQLPIKIVASGAYHDMGAFVSGVASLPRIVTLTNFSITPAKGGRRDNSNLIITITANTYRYKDLSKQKQKKNRKNKRKK